MSHVVKPLASEPSMEYDANTICSLPAGTIVVGTEDKRLYQIFILHAFLDTAIYLICLHDGKVCQVKYAVGPFRELRPGERYEIVGK